MFLAVTYPGSATTMPLSVVPPSEVCARRIVKG